MIKIVKGDVTFIDGVMHLLAVIRAEFKKEGLNIYQSETYPDRDIILNDLSKKDDTLVMLDDDEVIGFITSESEHDFFEECFDGMPFEYLKKHHLDSYIGRFVGYARLMVNPNYRNQGLATRLMKIFDEKYKGYVIIFLVDKENKNAQRLYAKLNYECLSLEKFSYGDYYVYSKNELK